MGKSYIHPNPQTGLKHFYYVFFALSLLFLAGAAVLWILLIGDQISRDNALGRLPFFLFMLSIALALIFSSFTIMARNGARWTHVSYFTVYLALPSMLLPVVGFLLCAYCLKKIAERELPELMFSRKSNRRGYHATDMNPRIYVKVPFYGSNIPAIAALTFIVIMQIVHFAMFVFLTLTD